MTARYLRVLAFGMVLMLAGTGCDIESEPDVIVFAAASTKGALDDVAQAFTTTTGRRVAISFAGSSVLARQIERGAPADVFVSANVAWMERLEAAGHVMPTSGKSLLGNELVLIAPRSARAPTNLAIANLLGSELPADSWLAMALVDAVPAGIYGKNALDSLGIWESVRSRIAQTDNARSALAMVARGEARMGIVYHTDALAEPRVAVLARFPATSHSPIVYPAAMTTSSHSPYAQAFLDFLRSPVAISVFERHGFVVLDR